MTHPDHCRVRLLEQEEVTVPRIREIYRIEQQAGRVRNLTRATAHSAAVWQTTTKALQIYDALRCVDRRLVDLLCLYTSLLNGCDYCVDDAAGEALRQGWQPGELLALGEKHADVYPAATVAALRYAAVLVKGGDAVDEDLLVELRRHFSSDEALVELTAVLSMKNFWNRFATALRIPPEGKCADPALRQSLFDLSRTLAD
ncbi:carboxymuconolactone decarboxylase family protein [Actinoplanes sp. NBRC 101535]|uniref:carboxymuconolactone decarboxylase family protein n=1 Tax=Actinoplanes sp. NBRC 101535 TaxID=3032196 RepID=UPI0024A3DFAF|nr:carboxymuconolactone decarboxylase family protein [Actinoplanes sp. NBRC 101535]GLY02722.1 alkyl hydroperoxide reductase AhpD [Actinoplanes sp. NBRC 101535]